MDVLLEADSVCAGYGSVEVLHDVSLNVRAGEVVVLLGSNGAGKTTTVRALAGIVKPSAGGVKWLGDGAFKPLHKRVREGMALITEHRAIVASLTVEENLRLNPRSSVQRSLELFPELVPLGKRKASLLSGGEQQILVAARTFAAEPKLLLADELSLGLAPIIVTRLLRSVRMAAESGLGVLIIEQQVRAALSIADRGYVMQHGRIVLEGTAAELSARIEEIEATYLSGVKEMNVTNGQ
ncbi:MAG TPA: ABC transporter ATP-binding protein [Acidimicrobiales bacterium]|jgi:branched-chain amino acid transport system ATP-binding protein